jgi:putative flippase GtrA
LKSILSGGITALVDLSLLYFFRERLYLSYWLSVNISFAISIIVNFSLQKFWTFSNLALNLAHTQFAKFILVAIGNMAMNSVIMYALSNIFGFWYLGAQVITIGILSILNFVLYRQFIFK